MIRTKVGKFSTANQTILKSTTSFQRLKKRRRWGEKHTRIQYQNWVEQNPSKLSLSERESNGVAGPISVFEKSQKWWTTSLPYNTQKITHFSSANPNRANILGHHVAAVEGRHLRPTRASRRSHQVRSSLNQPRKLLDFFSSVESRNWF